MRFPTPCRGQETLWSEIEPLERHPFATSPALYAALWLSRRHRAGDLPSRVTGSPPAY